MRPEKHLEAFEERKETIFKWAIEVRGLENSQRIIGDNASKGIVELLSACLHKEKKIEEGFQINHTWFKSEKVFGRLPEFRNRAAIINKMLELEKICEKLSYGAPKQAEMARKAVEIFQGLERIIKEVMYGGEK
ncbi:MAG: hypothetical protein HYX24_06285 [Candidatus Aenigmarchaeota archaeon]|nr:hypothetical protein [Candidatus Aenigmarchaeota archaeon]